MISYLPPCMWTEAEISLLRKYYPEGGWRLCVKHIRTKTKDQIRHKAGRLSITVETTQFWTPEEDLIVVTHYEADGPLGCMPLLLKRSREAIKARAAVLGVRSRAGRKLGRKQQRRHEALLEKTGGPGRYYPEWEPLQPQKKMVIREGSLDAYNLPSLR